MVLIDFERVNEPAKMVIFQIVNEPQHRASFTIWKSIICWFTEADFRNFGSQLPAQFSVLLVGAHTGDRWSSVTGGRLWQVVVRVGCSAGRKLTIFSSRNECKTSKYIRDRIKYCVGSMLGSYLNFGNDSVVEHFAFLGHGSKHEQNPSLSKSWKISVWLS